MRGQPYIEAYTDDFRSCDGVGFRDNFTISTGDRLKKLFELAVQTFNGNRTGLMKFMPASFDEGSLWISASVSASAQTLRDVPGGMLHQHSHLGSEVRVVKDVAARRLRRVRGRERPDAAPR